jgi:hypothetical protein
LNREGAKRAKTSHHRIVELATRSGSSFRCQMRVLLLVDPNLKHEEHEEHEGHRKDIASSQVWVGDAGL